MAFAIAITGGSGCGKSTVAAALLKALRPGIAAMISEDWYYRDVAGEEGFDPATYDFDDLAVRDHALLISQLVALKAGRPVLTPRYDFHRHARAPEGVWQSPAEVLVLEGAHLLCREELAALFDLRVYIDTPADIRLMRRLVRDQRDRGRTQASVLEQYLRTVRPAHERLTHPSRVRAHHVLLDQSPAIEGPKDADVVRLIEPLLRDGRLAAYLRTPSGSEAS